MGSPAAVRLGVQWGYPFSLVRRLALVFTGVLSFCVIGAWLLSQPVEPGVILIHWIPVAIAILISLYVVELIGVTERPLPPLSSESLFWAIATSCIVMAAGYALVPTYPPSTMLVCAAPIVSALCVFLQRKWVEQRGAEAGIAAILFAGSRAEATRGMAELAAAPGVQVRTILLPESVRDRAPMAGVPISRPSRAMPWVREYDIQLLVVADALHEELRASLSPCAGAGCLVERVEDLVAKVQGRVNLDGADEIDMLGRLTNQVHRFSYQRLLDLVLTTLIAVPSFSIGLLVAVGIKLTSRGPVLFRQSRIGRWGREFTILKFRTMRADAEKHTGPVFAQADDPRITRFGRFLRRARLDELPQLVNVIRGDMSLVGPRPERPYFVRTLGQKIPFYDARHAVRPGLTGWAQIRYSYGSDDEDARNKLAYEIYYILHRSLLFYVAVMLETIKVVLFRRGSR